MRLKRSSLGLCGLLFVGIVTVTSFLAGCSDKTSPTTSDPVQDTLVQEFRSSDFSAATTCQPCHPDHYDEWSGSMHAYSVKDPVWMALNLLGQSLYPGALDQACTKCHSVIGSRAGETPWGGFVLDSISEVARDGVGCDLCHTISSIGALENAEIILSPGPTKFGTIADPIPTSAHESEYHPLYPTSEYCAACHDIITGTGLGLETTFREWRNGGFTMTGKTCNECHMPAYTGSAVPGGPERVLHRHTFPGTDLAFIDFPNKPEQLELATQLLRSALTVEVDVPLSATADQLLSFEVRLINDKTGHDVPSGATFMRQMWLAVAVTDGVGNTLYATGQLDANDDLMDQHSAYPERDSNLFNIQATMLRADSIPTLLTWEAAYLNNPSIKPGDTATADFGFVVPAQTSTDLTVDVKLHYRSFPPYVIRSLDLDSLLPITIIEMASETRNVTLQ